MTEQIINSQRDFDAYLEHMKKMWNEHHYLRVELKTGKQRSLTQNRALHLYCTMLSDSLNEAGFDFRETIKDGIDVPWTPELAKDYLWRPVQNAMTGHESTTKPEREQYSEVYEVLNRHLSSKLGIHVKWPSKDTMNENITS